MRTKTLLLFALVACLPQVGPPVLDGSMGGNLGGGAAGSGGGGGQRSGGTAQYVFTVPGTYGYFCDAHGTAAGLGMAGAIEVVP